LTMLLFVCLFFSFLLTMALFVCLLTMPWSKEKKRKDRQTIPWSKEN
jgi:hypothetical protein